MVKKKQCTKALLACTRKGVSGVQRLPKCDTFLWCILLAVVFSHWGWGRRRGRGHGERETARWQLTTSNISPEGRRGGGSGGVQSTIREPCNKEQQVSFWVPSRAVYAFACPVSQPTRVVGEETGQRGKGCATYPGFLPRPLFPPFSPTPFCSALSTNQKSVSPFPAQVPAEWRCKRDSWGRWGSACSWGNLCTAVQYRTFPLSALSQLSPLCLGAQT